MSIEPDALTYLQQSPADGSEMAYDRLIQTLLAISLKRIADALSERRQSDGEIDRLRARIRAITETPDYPEEIPF